MKKTSNFNKKQGNGKNKNIHNKKFKKTRLCHFSKKASHFKNKSFKCKAWLEEKIRTEGDRKQK